MSRALSAAPLTTSLGILMATHIALAVTTVNPQMEKPIWNENIKVLRHQSQKTFSI